MSDTTVSTTDDEERLDSGLMKIAEAMWRHRMLSLGIVGVGVLISIAIAFLMRPVYRSEVVVVPASDESDGAFANLPGQLGGLAALTGTSLGKASAAREEALGVLKSRDLIANYIQTHDLLPILFPDKWDPKRNAWRENVSDKPTIGDAVQKFEEDIRQVHEDAKSGLVTVTVDWYDRHLAADWANGLVQLANEGLRTRAVSDANAVLFSLQGELVQANVAELRNSLARLMEAQLKARTYASVRKEYAFKIVDPAVAPEVRKSIRPVRALIVILGGFASLLIAAVAVWLLNAISQGRQQAQS